MEIGNGFAQFIKGQVRQLALEASESLSCQFSRSRRHFLLRVRILNEHIDAPIVPFGRAVIEFAVLGRHEFEHLSVDVRFSCFGQFAADMVGHLTDVLLQALHILEDMVVDTLQEIRFFALVLSTDDEGIVDKAYFQRLGVRHLIGNGKLV